MAIDLILTIISGVIVGYFGLTVIVFGARALADFSIKPFDGNLLTVRIITSILGTCLLTMVLYEVGFVWTLMFAASNPGRHQELIRAWIGSSFVGFLAFSLIVFLENTLRKGHG